MLMIDDGCKNVSDENYEERDLRGTLVLISDTDFTSTYD